MAVIKNVYHQFGKFILEVPEMHLLPQRITWLKGPSGSGKTTLLRILCGLESQVGPYSFKVDGVELAKLSPEDRQLGVVFQDYRLFPHLDAEENIDLAWQARGLSLQAIHSMKSLLIETLELENCLKTAAEHLSGGEQQRVALARALIAQPRALLLDEPFSALDEAVAEKGRKLLKSLVLQLQITTLLISHHSADGEIADCAVSLGS